MPEFKFGSRRDSFTWSQSFLNSDVISEDSVNKVHHSGVFQPSSNKKRGNLDDCSPGHHTQMMTGSLKGRDLLQLSLLQKFDLWPFEHVESVVCNTNAGSLCGYRIVAVSQWGWHDDTHTHTHFFVGTSVARSTGHTLLIYSTLNRGSL